MAAQRPCWPLIYVWSDRITLRCSTSHSSVLKTEGFVVLYIWIWWKDIIKLRVLLESLILKAKVVRAFISTCFSRQPQDIRSLSWKTDLSSCNNEGDDPSTRRDLCGIANYSTFLTSTEDTASVPACLAWRYKSFQIALPTLQTIDWNYTHSAHFWI